MYGSIQTYGGHMDIWGVQMYRVYRHKGCIDVWGHMDFMGMYRHMGAYGCTCLPTTPEGIYKKFSFPLIMSHVHHISTEMEGKNL